MTNPGASPDPVLKGALAQGPACATLSALGALHHGALPQFQAAQLRRHVASCLRCGTELRLLAEFEAAAPLPAELDEVRAITRRLEQRFSPGQEVAPLVRRRPLLRRMQAAGLALAAALLIAAVGIALREARPPELRTPTSSQLVLRSGELSIFSPAGELPEAPAELRWQPWAGAASYSIRVMEVDRTQVWSAETRQTSLALPPAVRSLLVPHKPLLWEVTARDASGNALASSAIHRFQVRSKQ